jgi:hypothetical protein
VREERVRQRVRGTLVLRYRIEAQGALELAPRRLLLVAQGSTHASRLLGSAANAKQQCVGRLRHAFATTRAGDCVHRSATAARPVVVMLGSDCIRWIGRSPQDDTSRRARQVARPSGVLPSDGALRELRI